MQEDNNEIISQIFLFSGVERNFKPEELGNTVKFKSGMSIYECDDYPKAIAVLLKGKAEAFSQSNTALKIFETGSVFAVSAVFANEKTYVSRIVAKNDCEVLFIGEERLTELFKEYPKTAVNYISFLSEKIRFLNKKISLFTQDSVESKVYCFLLNRNSEEKLNMSLLSKTLGIGRTSLYRALNGLEEKNVIVRKDGKVSVLK